MESLLSGPVGLALVSWLGLSVGSFANVAIHRLPRDGQGVLVPLRSYCPACRRQLGWLENVPVLSWLMLRGRCLTCRASISWRYPLVELIVGALFVLLWLRMGPSDGTGLAHWAVAAGLAATCVVVSAIDLEHLIIPDAITLPGIVLGLLLSLALPALHANHPGFDGARPHASALLLAVGGLALGGGSLWLVGRLGNLVLRRQIEAAGVQDAMGLGDVKWMAAAGTLLGPLGAADAILAGCFSGALVGLAWKLLARLRSTPAPGGIPFGPYLCLGVLTQLVRPGAAWQLLSRLVPQPG